MSTINEEIPIIKAKRKTVRAISPTPSKLAASYPRTKNEQLQFDQQEEIKKLQQVITEQKIEQKNTKALSSIEDEDDFIVTCKHEETEINNGVIECCMCGQHLDEVMDQGQDWRFYGSSDNKNSSDPSRCQFRKSPDKGIRKDLEKLNLPPNVINIAEQYYFEVTQGEIKRGNLRKGIMFACVFEAYKDIKKHQTPDQLRALFCIDKKNGSRGITYFFRRKKKHEREYITAEHIIPKICEKFQFTQEATDEVLDLFNELKKKSPKLEQSYPQSISCGCVYYVLKRKNLDISGEQFGKIVGLSSITIAKKATEIEDILNSE